MKVKLLVNLAGSSGGLSGNAGDVRDVDDKLAQTFLDAGLVVEDDGAEAVEGEDDPETRTRKRK